MRYTLLHTLSNLILAQTFWSFFSTDCSHSCLSYDPICQQNQTHIKTQQLQTTPPRCLCPNPMMMKLHIQGYSSPKTGGGGGGGG